MSMFGLPQTQQQVGLHAFKAGKMNRVEGTRRVKPDSRRGLLYMNVEEDELLHLYWKDRKTNTVEDDLIIFPEEADFEPVSQCTSGRVFALKFKSSSQILFFWMQEKETVQDQFNARRVNQLISDPTSQSEPQPSTQADSGGAFNDLDLNQAASGMGISREQLMQLLSQDDSSAAADGNDAEGNPFASAVGGGNLFDQPMAGDIDPSQPVPTLTGAEAMANLRSLLSGIQVPGTPAQDQASSGEQRSQATQPHLSLSDLLTPAEVLPLIADPSFRAALFPALPESVVSDPPTEQEVTEIMTSPQWAQALRALTYALDHGELAPILHQLGLDPNDIGEARGVEAFIQAVARHVERQREGGANDRAETSGDRMEE